MTGGESVVWEAAKWLLQVLGAVAALLVGFLWRNVDGRLAALEKVEKDTTSRLAAMTQAMDRIEALENRIREMGERIQTQITQLQIQNAKFEAAREADARALTATLEGIRLRLENDVLRRDTPGDRKNKSST